MKFLKKDFSIINFYFLAAVATRSSPKAKKFPRIRFTFSILELFFIFVLLRGRKSIEKKGFVLSCDARTISEISEYKTQKMIEKRRGECEI